MVLRYAPLLWRQLNGPQVTAIIEAIFLFFRDLVQPKVDYFDKLNISTANDKHLNLFGIMLRVPRPLVWNTDDPHWARRFRFTEDETLSDQGFSDPDNPAISDKGGLLSYEYKEYEIPARIQLDTEIYRKMLLAMQEDDTGGPRVGSLLLLDKFISTLYLANEYTITRPDPDYPDNLLVTVTREDERAYTALLTLTRLWLPTTHISVSINLGG